MKERPILFSAPMVRAILDGRKTQTRRILNGPWADALDLRLCKPALIESRCPYGMLGDRLWVRETHAPQSDCWGSWARALSGERIRPDELVLHYAADYSHDERPFIEKWRPSIHMPRWASRILLEITGVRIERLQTISEADALAEGVTRQMRSEFGWAANESEETFNARQARSTYGLLWESINGPGSWAANPWVWVVEFNRVTP